MSNFFSKTITDAHEMAENQLATHNRIAEALETANLIAAHQASNLIVNDADRQEIEREILHRLGVRDHA